MTATDQNTPREFGWVLLEIMGHRQRIGLAREEEVAGSLMLRIDIPTEGDDWVTEYYGGNSIYALRPLAEEVARDHYARRDPRPARPLSYRPEAQLPHEDGDA